MPDSEIGWRRQTTTETIPWAFDLAAEMDQGDAVASATASLTDLLTGLSFPSGLAGTANVAGTVVTQSVTGLLQGHNYRLVLTADMGGSKATAVALHLSCPY